MNPDKALAELCRRSFYRFVQEFWHEIIEEDPVWNWHIEYLCEELQYLNSFVVARKPKPYDLIINIPPGSTKSTIVTQMYNAWVWTLDPAQRFISSSYSHNLSLSHSIKTRDIVLSDKYKALFPEFALKDDQASKSDFRNIHGGQRFTTSTRGGVTGQHAHQVLIDDPLNPQQSNSEIEIREANNHLGTLSSRKIDKAIAPTILIMQRVNQNDPSGHLLNKKKNIKHICLPAEDSDFVKPAILRTCYAEGLLDPIRLNRTVLIEAKTDLGSYGYAGQYKQLPAPEEGGLLKKEWFEIIDWDFAMARLTWNFIADTAYTKDESNDPSGWIAWAEYENGYIIRFAETDYLEFPELCKALPTFAQAHGYSRKSVVEVEPKASGKSLVQTLKKETKLNIKEGVPPSKDKTVRVKDSAPTCEAGRVKLIRGHWNAAFIDQVCTFPNATHDEWVDCLTIMVSSRKLKRRKAKRTN